MTRRNFESGVCAPSTRHRRSAAWTPWARDWRDSELRMALESVTAIRDPATRAWQATRFIGMHAELMDIRADAVNELHQRGSSWAEIGRQFGISKARAWKIAQPRRRKPDKT